MQTEKQYTVIRFFFSSSKILSKKCLCNINFGQTKLNENNFTSHGWALIEEIAPHAEDMAGEKEITCCVRSYHVYNAIWAAAIRVSAGV